MPILNTIKQWFYNTNQSVLCIYIGEIAVKAIQISKIKTKYQVDGFAVVAFNSDSNIDRPITLNRETIITAIKLAIKQVNTNLKVVTTCLNGASVISKNISIKTDVINENIEETVLINVHQFVPYLLDEINYDYVLGDIKSSDSNYRDVLFIASRKEDVVSIIELFKIAGLITERIDVETYAIKNACALIPEYIKRSLLDEIIAVVDLGFKQSIFTVIYQNKIIYSHELNIGGIQLLFAIEQEYQCTYKEADQKLFNILLLDTVSDLLLENFYTELYNRILRAIELFKSHTDNPSVSSLFLMGDYAFLPNINSVLESSLNIPVYITNPLLNMGIASHLNTIELNKIAPAFMVLCGLALGSIT